MDFLKDSRFSQYRHSTTMTKYFPINDLNCQTNASQNTLYQLFKLQTLTQTQLQMSYVQQQKKKKLKRRSTMEITQQKFLVNKTSQRLKNINSLFNLKKTHTVSDNQSSYKVNRKVKKIGVCGLKKQMMKFNSFTVQAQKFQKGIQKDKAKVNLLKKYNTLVGNHFQRFQVNEDRTRKQTKDHYEIINLLVQDDKAGDLFPKNLVRVKKHDQTDKQNLDMKKLKNWSTPIKKSNSLIILSEQKINLYTTSTQCEQKISRVTQKFRKSQIYLKNSTDLARCLKNNDLKNSTNLNRSLKNDYQKTMGSRFLKEHQMKCSQSKQNQHIKAFTLHAQARHHQNSVKKSKVPVQKKIVYKSFYKNSGFNMTYHDMQAKTFNQDVQSDSDDENTDKYNSQMQQSIFTKAQPHLRTADFCGRRSVCVINRRKSTQQ